QPPPAQKPPAAQPPREEFDYRRFFRKPTKTLEFWEALKFELDVGRPDLAAGFLRDMLKKKPTPEELVQLHEKEGVAAILRLRFVPRWDENKDKDRQAREDVEVLLQEMIAAVKAKVADPKRIRQFVKNLYESPEENAFAKIELAKSGAAAVPYLVEELIARPEIQRGVLIETLSQLGPDTVRPLLAALDIDNPDLRVDLLEALRRRKDFILLRNKGIDPGPALWPLASPPQRSALVRRPAAEALAVLSNVRTPDQLPSARDALTAEAERYYYHRVRFPDPRRVVVWRWDGKKLFEDSSFTASKAEEYFGLRYAR